MGQGQRRLGQSFDIACDKAVRREIDDAIDRRDQTLLMFKASVGRPRTFERCRVEHGLRQSVADLLQEAAEWEEFDAFASESSFGKSAARCCRTPDSAVDRVWTVRILDEDFWLAFDNWRARHYELSARTDRGDTVVVALAAGFGVHSRRP